MSNLEYDKSEILSTITLFSVVGIRIMPSVSKIIHAFNSLKNCQPSLEVVYFELKENEKLKKINNLSKVSLNKNIHFEKVFYKYENKNDFIFEDLDLEINKGESIFITGDSGSGKTTLINLLIGLINPTKGKITIDNKEQIDNNYNNLKIGYVSQNTLLLDDTIENNIIFGEKNDKHDLVYEKSISISGINSLNKNLNFSNSMEIGEQGNKISGGQRQRIAIARSIYFNPDIFIFDEATNELDENSEFKIFKELMDKYKDKTFIFISHNKKLANLCEKILNIKDNKVTIIKNSV